MNNHLLKKARKDVSHDLHELCRDLIRTPSLSGQEGRLAELAKKRMREFGYDETSIDSMGNVVSIKNGQKRRPLLLFEGHMDTVPPGDRRHWRDEPFSGKIAGDLIFGRGAVDMKGALAGMIVIPRIMKTLGIKCKGRLVTGLVVLEEPCEGLAIRNLLEEKKFKPDAVVLGEPSELNLKLGQRGRFEISVRTRGKTCHSSMPERGVNAIYKMAPLIARLEKLNEHLPSHPLLGRGSVAAFKIVSSPAEGNVVPDNCEVLLDRRTLPNETKLRVLKEIRNALRVRSYPVRIDIYKRRLETYTGRQLETEQAFPGWRLNKNHRLVRLAEKSVAEALGRPPMIGTWRFGTDGTYTAGVRKIPTIGFGPGKHDLAHSPNENVSLSDVASAAMGYALIAKNFTEDTLF